MLVHPLTTQIQKTEQRKEEKEQPKLLETQIRRGLSGIHLLTKVLAAYIPFELRKLY